MLKLLSQTQVSNLPTDLLQAIAREELSEDSGKDLHVVVHRLEIIDILNSCKRRVEELWLQLWGDEHAWANIIRNVALHTDRGIPDDEALLLIVTHVEGILDFTVWNQKIRLSEWQALYFDPHVRHGVTSENPQDNATLIRIAVKKI